jgi:hypothetical protein
MKFGAKRDPLRAQLGFFRAKFHSKSLYSVEKTIVGISQYAYFSCAMDFPALFSLVHILTAMWQHCFAPKLIKGS